MKNGVAKVLIGIALMFTAGAAYSEPVEYTISTNGVIFIDPLLTGLTSVSGTFIYENAAAPIAIDPMVGNTVYFAWGTLSGSADGNNFSSPLGQIIVGNDTFTSGMAQNEDFFLLATDTGQNLNGFTFAGMPLNHVFIFWIEGQENIPDFLDDQSLPSVLPPTTSGRLALGFVDPAGLLHSAFFSVTVVPGSPVDTSKFNFQGQLSIVEEDNGGSVYSGVPIGSDFSIEIDLVTAFSTISDGTTVTPFSAFFSNGSFFEVTNDFVVEADDAAFVNSLAGTNFVAGDLVDLIELAGVALTSGGGSIEIGVSYVLDPLAFDDENPNNYPPDPDDILTTIFFIDEEDVQGVEIYSAAGVVDSDGDGMPDNFELANGFDPNNPADADEDADSDGLTNLEEFIAGTLPHNPDTDGDTVLDGLDAFPNDPNESVDTDGNGIGNNADPDDDGDGMPDDFELANRLDPLNAADANADADGDGFTNLEEFQAGTDPQNAADHPPVRKVPVSIFILLGDDEE